MFAIVGRRRSAPCLTLATGRLRVRRSLENCVGCAIGLLAIAACVPATAHAEPRWTFCVGSSKRGADVWVTEVFAAERSRVEIERAFKATLERSGAAGADVQCPEPRADKTDAVNAQFEAEEFNRKLGATLHAVSAGELPPRQ